MALSVDNNGPDAGAGTTSNSGAALAGASAKSQAKLHAIQANLKNSQVLPDDFKRIPDFSLLDGDGQQLTADIMDGQWNMLFFGYTHCPDVCPVTLSVMKSVIAELDIRQADPMQVLFISVDPVRDTPDVMKKYVAYFNEKFVGVSGELNAINDLTSALGIVAAFTANDEDPNNYTVDHTASMLLVDPQRQIRAKFNAPHEVGSIVDDYLTLRAQIN